MFPPAYVLLLRCGRGCRIAFPRPRLVLTSEDHYYVVPLYTQVEEFFQRGGQHGGSYPDGPNGLHRSSRHAVSTNPRAAPNSLKDLAAYSLQVGVNRQAGGNSGEISPAWSGGRWATRKLVVSASRASTPPEKSPHEGDGARRWWRVVNGRVLTLIELDESQGERDKWALLGRFGGRRRGRRMRWRRC